MTVSTTALLAAPPSSTRSRLRTTPNLPFFNSSSSVVSLLVRYGEVGSTVETNQDGKPSAATK